MQIYPPDDPFLLNFMLGSIPIALRWYGVLIVGGAMIAAQWGAYRAQQRSQDPEHVWNLVVLGMILGIAGARVYYVIFEWPRFANQSIWMIINPATGGLAIHGALIGAVLAALIYTRRHQLDLREWLDIMMPTFMLAQAIGRWGNFFNQEAYGRPTPFGVGLIIDAQYRIPPYNDLDKYPLTTLFHPTFLYESLWNLAGVGVLIAIERRFRDVLRRGDMVLFYAIIYGLGRLWIEGLRTDSLCTDLVGGSCADALRVAQIASIVLIAAGVIGLWLNHARAPELGDVTAPLPVAPLYDETPAVPTMPMHPSDIADTQATDAIPQTPDENPRATP
jgi:phosphatidylglycerol:prolipoprotein diacylglycerol transferase